MGERYDAHENCTPGRTSHLPPLDKSLLLHVTSNGTIKAVEKLPMPVNEFGIPEATAIMEAATETLAAGYEFPTSRWQSNVHHLVYPRRQYHQHTSGKPIPSQYRESAALMVRIPKQFHNYIHEIFRDPKEPTMDVMQQWVREQSQVSQLFNLGKLAIQLSRSRADASMTQLMERQHYRYAKKPDPKLFEGLFYDFLDSYPDGQLGLMPDKEWLASQTITKATRALGTLAGARSIDARRDTRALIKKVGYPETEIAA